MSRRIAVESNHHDPSTGRDHATINGLPSLLLLERILGIAMSPLELFHHGMIVCHHWSTLIRRISLTCRSLERGWMMMAPSIVVQSPFYDLIQSTSHRTIAAAATLALDRARAYDHTYLSMITHPIRAITHNLDDTNSSSSSSTSITWHQRAVARDTLAARWRSDRYRVYRVEHTCTDDEDMRSAAVINDTSSIAYVVPKRSYLRIVHGHNHDTSSFDDEGEDKPVAMREVMRVPVPIPATTLDKSSWQVTALSSSSRSVLVTSRDSLFTTNTVTNESSAVLPLPPLDRFRRTAIVADDHIAYINGDQATSEWDLATMQMMRSSLGRDDDANNNSITPQHHHRVRRFALNDTHRYVATTYANGNSPVKIYDRRATNSTVAAATTEVTTSYHQLGTSPYSTIDIHWHDHFLWLGGWQHSYLLDTRRLQGALWTYHHPRWAIGDFNPHMAMIFISVFPHHRLYDMTTLGIPSSSSSSSSGGVATTVSIHSDAGAGGIIPADRRQQPLLQQQQARFNTPLGGAATYTETETALLMRLRAGDGGGGGGHVDDEVQRRQLLFDYLRAEPSLYDTTSYGNDDDAKVSVSSSSNSGHKRRPRLDQPPVLVHESRATSAPPVSIMMTDDRLIQLGTDIRIHDYSRGRRDRTRASSSAAASD